MCGCLVARKEEKEKVLLASERRDKQEASTPVIGDRSGESGEFWRPVAVSEQKKTKDEFSLLVGEQKAEKERLLTALCARKGKKEGSSRALCSSERKRRSSTIVKDSIDSTSAGIIVGKLEALEEDNRELRQAKFQLEERLNVLGTENERLREAVVSASGSSTDPFSFPSPLLESSAGRFPWSPSEPRDGTSQALPNATSSKRVVRFGDASYVDISPASAFFRHTLPPLEQLFGHEGPAKRRSSRYSMYSAQSEGLEDEAYQSSLVPTWLEFDRPKSPCDSPTSSAAASSRCVTMDLMSGWSSLEDGAGSPSPTRSPCGQHSSPKEMTHPPQKGSSNVESFCFGPGCEPVSPSSSHSPRFSALPTALTCPPPAAADDDYEGVSRVAAFRSALTCPSRCRTTRPMRWRRASLLRIAGDGSRGSGRAL